MTFTEMRTLMLNHFAKMVEDNKAELFTVEVDKDRLWSLYLDSFPVGKNPVYKERTEHDCSCCRHFIKTMGNVVTIKDGEVISIWDFDIDGDDTYEPSIKAMREYVHSRPIGDKFFTHERRIGTEHNNQLTEGELLTWEHFYADIPERFVLNRNYSIAENMGQFRDTRNVFKRSLNEITTEAVSTVLELIAQGSLYRGEEHKWTVAEFSKHKAIYNALSDEKKETYTWEKASEVGVVVGRIRNHSIGQLLVDISEGMELDSAVTKYEAIVAPANYKRPKAIFTKKMLEEAKKTLTDLGYLNSLNRRYATLDDITVNNILFSNRDAARRMTGKDIFEEMADSIAVNPKKFNKVEEINIKDFINNVLPTAQDIEVLFESKFASNMVSLIAPEDKDSKTMFKWNNNFCWAYTGNVADSMKARVKSMGGKVDGVLRFSIQWNEDGGDNSDLDAHCIEPNRNEIFFGHCRKPNMSPTTGQLDVDIIHPNGKIAVENIAWSDKDKMKEGTYKFFVNQYSGSTRNGFRAEIEFDGQIYSFDYSNPTRTDENINVAEVTLKNGEFSIKTALPNTVNGSRDIWGIQSNQFVPVSVVMYSPNYWDEQDGIGNKHYFFMLKDCVNPETPNAFYNEYLNNELDKHKHVMEALGSKLAVVNADDQLSGIGFSSTKRNSIIVKVKGSTERVLKVNI